jgi:glycosyltransferase involved in cell wall biosynthesis
LKWRDIIKFTILGAQCQAQAFVAYYSLNHEPGCTPLDLTLIFPESPLIPMKSDKKNLHVGIMALRSNIGGSGGIGIFVHQLVSALSNYDTKHCYTVFLSPETASWSKQDWPPHVSFKTLTGSYLQKHFCNLKCTVKRPFTNAFREFNQQLQRDILTSAIKQLDIDILHFPGTIMRECYRDMRIPSLLTYFDMQHEYFPEFFTTQILKDRFKDHRESVRAATLIWSPSKFTTSTLIEKFGTSPQSIRNLPLGITHNFSPPTAELTASIRAKYDLPSEYFFYPANPWLHKNHSRLIAALRHCKDYHHKQFWLVTTGRLQQNTCSPSQLALAAGVEGQILDLGFVPTEDVAPLMLASQALIFPSLFEGFGIPLLEAMNLGVPIGASRTTSIPELVQDSALLFDPFSIDDIAGTLMTLSDQKDTRQRLACRGRELAAQYDWPLLVPQIEQLYDETYYEYYH